MLFRPYTIDAILGEPLSSRTKALLLSSIPSLSLSDGDWCYLKLEEYGKIEIIKVEQTQGCFLLTRGVDNTKPTDFAAARITYTLTVSEIHDGIPDSGNLTVYGEGAAEAVGTEVYVARPLVGYIGVHYSFGSDAVVRIGRQENAYGCCGADNEVGGLGFGIFYLTSLIYPLEVLESANSFGALQRLEFSSNIREASTGPDLLNIAQSMWAQMHDAYHIDNELESLDLTYSVNPVLRRIIIEQPVLEELDLTYSVNPILTRILVETALQENMDITSYGLQLCSLA
jgi:hypothetical protein